MPFNEHTAKFRNSSILDAKYGTLQSSLNRKRKLSQLEKKRVSHSNTNAVFGISNNFERYCISQKKAGSRLVAWPRVKLRKSFDCWHVLHDSIFASRWFATHFAHRSSWSSGRSVISFVRTQLTMTKKTKRAQPRKRHLYSLPPPWFDR